jgi:hypothetical protein
MVVMEGERCGADFNAVQAFDKARPIGAAPKLAVGNDLEPDLLLHSHRFANAFILNVREFIGVNLSGRMTFERLPQCGRPQQAADMLCPKRRLPVWSDPAHALTFPPAAGAARTLSL